MRVATQRAATVQLNIELVVVTTGTIDVDAERIVSEPYFVRRKQSKQGKKRHQNRLLSILGML